MLADPQPFFDPAAEMFRKLSENMAIDFCAASIRINYRAGAAIRRGLRGGLNDGQRECRSPENKNKRAVPSC